VPSITVTLGQAGRLDKVLAGALAEADTGGAALSRSRISRLIAEGAVRRGGVALTDGSALMAPGDAIEVIWHEAAPVATEGQDIPLAVVFEDDNLIVVDKPAGMVVHPAPGSPDGTLVNALIAHCGDRLKGIGGERRPGIVHRIDKDTTGLLVAAKSDRAHHGLSEQFAAHTVDRAYLALAQGVPQVGDPRLRGLRGVTVEPGGVIVIATNLDRHPTDRQRQAVTWGEKGRHAVTRVQVERVLADGAASLVRCRLETGRTHQIRVHMTYAGHPLIGDQTYGARRRLPARVPGAEAANAFPRQALHAATLGFVHPVTGATLTFESPLPPEMAELLAALGG
jgi:23S rRNA pseudouridine1911/1915/1917 synthase